MPYRYFTDPRGTAWRVWDVRPTRIERRVAIRRIRVTKLHHPERRVLPTRRIDMGTSRLYFPESETGWLCFECGSERLRLKPIPDGWAAMSDEGLDALRGRAMPRRTCG
jgi:hypothetical protein